MTTAPITPTNAQRVEDALSLLAPKWTVWLAQTLAQHEHHLRVGDVADQLPFIGTSTISTRLSQMHTEGLVTRAGDRYGAPYTLSALGGSLTPVYRALSDWSQTNLGLGPVAGAERVEDAARRLHLRHTTSVIKVLATSGPMRLLHISDEAALETNTTLQRLKRLQNDGLVTRTGPRHGDPYALTDAGQALGPVYAAIDHWHNPAAARGPSARPTPVAVAHRTQTGTPLVSDDIRTAAALRRSTTAPGALFSHPPQPQPPVSAALTAQSSPSRGR
ncbi:winged helix-turn-helix transcriptional regulator [Streptomyces sp. NPDC002932]|uniref:winged helix-turn-helix transcriptional regulator n=1 Tax=Streptomyces sp. NPDC002932 TaxID=3364672 RepID=UPI0036B6CB83